MFKKRAMRDTAICRRVTDEAEEDEMTSVEVVKVKQVAREQKFRHGIVISTDDTGKIHAVQQKSISIKKEDKFLTRRGLDEDPLQLMHKRRMEEFVAEKLKGMSSSTSAKDSVGVETQKAVPIVAEEPMATPSVVSLSSAASSAALKPANATISLSMKQIGIKCEKIPAPTIPPAASSTIEARRNLASYRFEIPVNTLLQTIHKPAEKERTAKPKPLLRNGNEANWALEQFKKRQRMFD